MTGLRTAIAFLTRLPLPGGAPAWSAEGLARAAVWFPVVGVLVGAIAAGVRALAGLALPSEPATVLALVAAILVTGALHEDGLADAADGLGAHGPREGKLEIMRDSRVGTYGSLGVVLPLLFAYAALAPLDAERFAQAAICGHVLGRWSTLPQARFLPMARELGAGAAVSVTSATLAIGTAFSAAVVLAVAGVVAGLVAVAVAAVVGAVCGLGLRRVLGGVTGDTFGAVNKLTEVATYGALVAAWPA